MLREGVCAALSRSGSRAALTYNPRPSSAVAMFKTALVYRIDQWDRPRPGGHRSPPRWLALRRVRRQAEGVGGLGGAPVTNGVYRFTRNPMYLGMALILVGAALLFGTLTTLLPIPMFLWIIQGNFIRGEERFLEAHGTTDGPAIRQAVRQDQQERRGRRRSPAHIATAERMDRPEHVTPLAVRWGRR